MTLADRRASVVKSRISVNSDLFRRIATILISKSREPRACMRTEYAAIVSPSSHDWTGIQNHCVARERMEERERDRRGREVERGTWLQVVPGKSIWYVCVLVNIRVKRRRSPRTNERYDLGNDDRGRR